MLKLVRRAAALVVLPIVAAGAAVTLSVAPSEAAPSNTAQVVNLTNAQRVKQGCPKLRTNAALSRAAAAHSRDMATRGYFGHVNKSGKTYAQRAQAAGYKYAIGENIAMGYSTPSAVVNAWMKSSGHRANILNCKSRSIGVGVAANSKGVLYWTQVFGRV